MFDARDLLGRLLQSGLSGSTNERLGNAMGPSGLGQGGNPLSDILSQLSGLAGASQGSATQGGAAQGGFGQGGFGQGGAGQGGFGQSGLSEALGQGGLGGLANMAESVLGQISGGGAAAIHWRSAALPRWRERCSAVAVAPAGVRSAAG
ncbi:hypothetical protein [Defluviicoccus vanus]|uniref:hypothetical protein n=1 Tax=Defluviicoccus vanus TaxID=111831 RepID=UPI001CBA6097|nr:hypothetical protein [Defluviicoccus vanus]